MSRLPMVSLFYWLVFDWISGLMQKELSFLENIKNLDFRQNNEKVVYLQKSFETQIAVSVLNKNELYKYRVENDNDERKLMKFMEM